MADQNQDFNIKVVTTADTRGIQQTSVEFDKLKQQQATFAATASKQAADARAAAASGGGGGASTAAAGASAGLSGTAVGIGSIVTLLTVAINRWKQFNDELARTEAVSLAAIQKTHELGLAIVEMQDKAISARRLATEPLEVSFSRLTQDVTRLKTEMDIAFQSGRFDDWKKLNADLATTQSQLNGVTEALKRQKAEADKAAQSELEKRVPGLKPQDQVKEADAQTQAILKNEQAAAAARAQGKDAEADQFQKSAEQYKASATPQQLADLQRIHELQDKLKPPAPPEYRPLTPEEFARQQEAAEPGGAGAKLSSEEMRQRQLDNQADRYRGVQDTRQESNKAMVDRLNEIRDLQRQMLAIWR